MRRTEYQSGEAQQDLGRIEALTDEVRQCHLAAIEAEKESERLAKKSTQLGKQTGLALLRLQKIVGYGCSTGRSCGSCPRTGNDRTP